MPKLFLILPVLLFTLITIPSHAVDWCGRSDGSIAPCLNNIVPNGWTRCGTMRGDSVWCHPSVVQQTNATTNKNDNKEKKLHRFSAGLSLGYVASVDGGMTADYANYPDAWVVPGSFGQSDFEIGRRSIPLQASFGVRVIENLRLDISYTYYSGITMPDWAHTATGGRNGFNDYFSFHMNGGDVTSSAAMLNAYYNLDSLTGRFMNGKLSPYIGAGIGMGINKVSDYEISDPGLYLMVVNDVLTGDGSSNIIAHHSGGKTKNNLVYMFEAGGTWEFYDWLMLDVFGRWTYLGKVETNGDVVLKQTVWQGGAPIGDETTSYKGYAESGTLSMWDIGARLRFLF